MRSLNGVFVGLLITGVAASGLALDAARCNAPTQDCLNYMTSSLAERGWVGIEMDDEDGIDKMVVSRVIDESPADKAGFRKGDQLVAVNGVPFAVANKKKIKVIQSEMTPGAEYVYTIARRGTRKDLRVKLVVLPDNVKAQMIGHHMVEHAEIKVASAQTD